jgi:hypothetical protein
MRFPQIWLANLKIIRNKTDLLPLSNSQYGQDEVDVRDKKVQAKASWDGHQVSVSNR